MKQETWYRFRTTGDKKFLSVSCVFVPPDLVMVHAEDITERKRAEEALRESEQRYRTLVETIPHGIQEIDTSGVITFSNAAYDRMFGYEREESIGRRIWDMAVDDSEKDRIIPLLKRAAEGRLLPTPYYAQRVTKRGEVFDVQVDWNHKRDETGKVIGFIAVITDVTQRKREEAEARQRLNELAHFARLNTMGQLIAELAHELGQPLFAIANYAEACCETFRSGADVGADELSRWMTEVRQQANRAGLTLRRLRRLVRKAPPHWSTVGMDEVIEEVLELIAPGAKRSRVQIRFRPAERLPLVVVNRLQIEQVIVNLVQNAVQAVADVPADRRTVSIETSCHGHGAVQVAVSDTGEGLTPESIGRVFEPFYTTQSDGIGMGLAICRSIVESHGGQLRAAPNPDHGSTFSFTIPTPGQEENSHGK